MKDYNKRLLIISSGFPNEKGNYLSHTFVKGFVNEAKDFFSEIKVLVLLPRLPFLNSLFNKKYPNKLKDYSFDNVEVFYKRYLYIPMWPFTNYKGRLAFYLINKKDLDFIKNDKTIIHANFTSPAGVFAYYLSKKIKNNYYLTVHEDHNWLMQEIEKKNPDFIKTWKNAKVLIRVNYLDNKLLSHYNKKVVTIPNGFNHRIFKVLDKELSRDFFNIKKDKKVIVNIGFYNEQKNQSLLIDAIALLPESIKSELVCFIIGGGLKHNALKKAVKVNGLERCIRIVGQVDQDKLPIYLNTADLFCLSSNSEGNPTVMFEALGVGLPYVGTNVGGIPEIIKSEKYGLLCQPGNPKELRDIIIEGLKKDWNKKEILEYSRNFTWKSIFNKTQQYYIS